MPARGPARGRAVERASRARASPSARCPAGVPIGALIGDSHAALFGHAAFDERCAEGHVRHGQLADAARRRRLVDGLARPGGHGRLGPRPDRLCPRGQHHDDRRHRAVAGRPGGPARPGCGRGPGGERRLGRRRLPRARVRGARRSVLGRRGARGLDQRPDARIGHWPSWPVPPSSRSRTRCATSSRPCRRPAARACHVLLADGGVTRNEPAHAVPGGHPRRARPAQRHAGALGPRCCLPGRPGRGHLGLDSTSSRRCRARSSASSRDGRSTSASASMTAGGTPCARAIRATYPTAARRRLGLDRRSVPGLASRLSACRVDGPAQPWPARRPSVDSLDLTAVPRAATVHHVHSRLNSHSAGESRRGPEESRGTGARVATAADRRQPVADAAARAALAEQLARRATEARLRDLRMVYEAGLGHLGGEFSAIDILTTLYFGGPAHRPGARPDDPERDRFILSKGHAAAALYVTLAAAGLLRSRRSSSTFLPPLSRLNGHPDRTQGARASRRTPDRSATACRSRSASRSPAELDGSPRRTFVLTGDGELQEGSMWEAAMAAGHFGLDGLTAHRRPQRPPAGRPHRAHDAPRAARGHVARVRLERARGGRPRPRRAPRDLPLDGPFEAGRPSCVIARHAQGPRRLVHERPGRLAPPRPHRRRVRASRAPSSRRELDRPQTVGRA